jgi:ribosomal protein S18 acetylase RimI-like enzyme
VIEVKKASVSDSQLLALLGRRAFQEAFGQFNDPTDMQAYLDLSFHQDRIKSQLEDPAVIYLTAYYQGDPVGYAKLVRGSKTSQADSAKRQIQMERIYALGAYVGKKVGKTLMIESIQIAKSEGYEYMWLGVWQENKRAIDFYRAFGFEIIGVKQFVIGNEVNDDYVMGRNLI